MSLAEPNQFSELGHNIVLYIAEILRKLEQSDSKQPSRSVVAFVSTCRELRVVGLPVSAGLIKNGAQCEQLSRGRDVYRVVSAVVGSHAVLTALTRSWSASLQELKLMPYNDINDVSALAQYSSLQKLDLGHSMAITDVSALAYCTSLRTLDLTGCLAITDVSALAKCSSLRTLNLRDCRVITDVSALANCSSLHTLNLTDCDAITDVSALSKCSSLHTLNLMCCYAITDLSALSRCSSLRIIR
jgi:hypothetical protein